jgi:hypothetical protein
MFVVVTVFAAYIGYYVNWIHQRHAFLAEEEEAREAASFGGDQPIQQSPPPSVLWLFGETGWEVVRVVVQGCDETKLTNDDIRRATLAKRLFPESQIYALHYCRTKRGSHTWMGGILAGPMADIE